LKRFVATIFMVLALSVLFATTYTIDNYNFIFEGKTDVSMVYSKLALEDFTQFESYEDLVDYVKSKEREIHNWGIFNGTESTVIELEDSVEEEKHYIAVFEINDKSPLFIFPTPKYDSNTGLSIGIKMDSKNFLGKLALFTVNAKMEQTNNSFKEADYTLNFNLSKLPIGGFNMDNILSFEYDGGEKDFLKGTTLSLTSKLYGINISSFKMDVSSTLEFEGIESLSTSSWTLSSSFYDIKLGSANFKIGGYLEFTPTSNDIKTFGLSEFNYSTTLSNLLNSIGGFTLSHALTSYPRIEKTVTKNSLSYGGLKLRDKTVTLTLSIDTVKFKSNDDMDITKKEHISVPFSLPFGFTFTPGVTFQNTYKANLEEKIKDWSVDKNVILAASLSRSNLSKVVDGNQDFYEGISFSFSVSRTMPLLDFLAESSSQYAILSMKWFPVATTWINPSIRISGIVSTSQGIGLLSNDSESPTIAEYMRGIRNNNEYNETSWNTRVAANINLTTKCINLGSWARTYAIPFVDIAYLEKKDQDAKWLYTVGIEGIGIINNHSNYPVRASLGFNTESIKTFMDTKDFDDLEYELFFGLGFFY